MRRRAKCRSAAATKTNGRFCSSRSTADVGNEDARVLVRRLDLHAHEHVAPQHDDSCSARAMRTATAFAAGIDERRDVVDAARQRRRLASVMTSTASPTATSRRSLANTFAMTHIVLRSAIVKHGVVPACSSCPAADELLDDRAVDRRADRSPAIGARLALARSPAICDSSTPSARMLLDRRVAIRLGGGDVGLRLLELARARARRS